ncbi:MAG TPA: ATP-grasp domain-containing protein [Gemmatimonadaceae bacterium]|nr:ATP-grasp domain-containing protein [Gemmatimonadaceae bacterium]
MRVLLLDEGFISGAVTARGLARAGCHVDVIAATGGRGACSTAHGTWTLAPRVGDPRLLVIVEEAASAAPYDVIYPVTEPLQWLLWSACPAWSAAVFPRIPEPDRRARRDKRLLSARVASAGVTIPQEKAAGTEDEVRHAAGALGLPIVIKGVRGRGGNATTVCETPGDAWVAARQLQERGVCPFAQAYIRGSTYLAGGLFDGGRMLRFFGGEKTVQFPARIGPAAVLTSVDDPALALAASRVAGATRLTGLASMDFVRDADGRYHFLELNPRPWGSIQAAACAGVDLFADLVRLWRSEMPMSSPDAIPGVCTPIFPLYLLSAQAWRTGAAALALLPDARRALSLARVEPALAAHLVHRLTRVAVNWS